MPVKTEPLKQVRLKPETYQALGNARDLYPVRVPLWELANAAIMAGLQALRLEQAGKPQRKSS